MRTLNSAYVQNTCVCAQVQNTCVCALRLPDPCARAVRSYLTPDPQPLDNIEKCSRCPADRGHYIPSTGGRRPSLSRRCGNTPRRWRWRRCLQGAWNVGTRTHTRTQTHTLERASMRGRAMLDPVPRSASRAVDQTPHNQREGAGAFDVGECRLFSSWCWLNKLILGRDTCRVHYV
jgi:hypothetical protein